MAQLRHLWLDEGFLPFPFPAQKDHIVLESIQTLSSIKDFRCTKEVLEIMPDLKKLGTSYYHDERTKWSSYEFNNFVCLHQLQILKCLFIAKGFRARTPLPVNFAFPPSLRKLTLRGCKLSWERMTVIGSLPNLEVLKLKEEAFEGSEWEPNEEEFSKLKFLLLEYCNLQHWRANCTHFPRLQHLILIDWLYLEEIPSEIGDIPTLEMLELYGCSFSPNASAKLIREEQRMLENNGLKIHISSSVYHSGPERTSLRQERIRPIYSESLAAEH